VQFCCEVRARSRAMFPACCECPQLLLWLAAHIHDTGPRVRLAQQLLGRWSAEGGELQHALRRAGPVDGGVPKAHSRTQLLGAACSRHVSVVGLHCRPYIAGQWHCWADQPVGRSLKPKLPAGRSRAWRQSCADTHSNCTDILVVK
jgi:hypothetical protein